jgi:hypothetical protein
LGLQSAETYLIQRSTQLWNSLTKQQKIALKAVIEQSGASLRAAAVLSRYGLASSTMHKTLKALDARGVVREEEAIGTIRYRLEDPFFAPWLRLGAAGGHMSSGDPRPPRIIARRCTPLRLGASLSEGLRSKQVGRAPAPSNSGLSRNLRGYESAPTWITLSFMDQNLCRLLTPRAKSGRSRPTAAAAAPATSHWVHAKVVGRK